MTATSTFSTSFTETTTETSTCSTKAIDFYRDDDMGFNGVANLARTFPWASVKLDNLDLATLNAAGKEMVQ